MKISVFSFSSRVAFRVGLLTSADVIVLLLYFIRHSGSVFPWFVLIYRVEVITLLYFCTKIILLIICVNALVHVYSKVYDHKYGGNAVARRVTYCKSTYILLCACLPS